MILIAPPAVAFVGYTRLTGGGIDAFAHILLNSAYVFAALVAVQVPRLMKLPFALSFGGRSAFRWGRSLGWQAFVYGREAASGVHIGIGLAVLALLGRRGRRAVVADPPPGIAILRDEICRPE